MKVINLKQSSQEWLDWRKTGVTASDVSCLFGTNPFKTEWQLWAEKTGRRIEDDLSGNPYVRQGKEFEFTLREFISDKMNVGLFPLCVQHESIPHIKSSLDGVDGSRRPWELKIPSENNFDLVVQDGMLSEPVQRYLLQVHHQILTTGAKEGFLVFGKLDHDGPRPRIVDHRMFVIPADLDVQADIKNKVAKFMRKVERDDPPSKDPNRDLFSPEAPEDARIWQAAAAAVLPLIEQKKRLKEQLEDIDQQIKAEALPALQVLKNNKSGVFSGLRITRVDRIGSVDWHALLQSKGLDPNQPSVIGPFQKTGTSSYQYSAI